MRVPNESFVVGEELLPTPGEMPVADVVARLSEHVQDDAVAFIRGAGGEYQVFVAQNLVPGHSQVGEHPVELMYRCCGGVEAPRRVLSASDAPNRVQLMAAVTLEWAGALKAADKDGVAAEQRTRE